MQNYQDIQSELAFYISHDEFSRLEEAHRVELYEHADAVLTLMRDLSLSLSTLHSLDKDFRVELYSHSAVVVTLLTQTHVSLERFRELSEDLRSEFYDNIDDAVILLRDAGISLEILRGLSARFRRELYANSDAVAPLLTKAAISLETIRGLDGQFRVELYCHASRLGSFVSETGISFNILRQLDRRFRLGLYGCRKEVAETLRNPHYDYLIQRGLLDQQSLLEEVLTFDLLVYPYSKKMTFKDDAISFQGIKSRVTARLNDLGLFPAHRHIEASDMNALIEVVKGLFEIRKNAIIFNLAPRHSGLGDLPNALKRQILQWTGHRPGDEFEEASHIHKEVMLRFPK